MRARVIVLLGLSVSFLIGTFTLRGGLSFGSLTGLGIHDILKFWATPLLFAASATLFSVLLKQKPPAKSFLRGSCLLAGGFLALGYVLLLVCKALPAELRVLAVCCSAALTGVGYSLFLLFWQHHLSQFSLEETLNTLLLSLAIGSAAYLVLFFALQSYASWSFIVLVLASSLLCLLATRFPASQKGELPSCKQGRYTLKTILVEIREPLICVSAIAFLVTLTRTVALGNIDNTSAVNIFDGISVVAVSLALYLVCLGFKKKSALAERVSILGIYLVSFPVLATALLALSVFGSSLSLMVATLVNAVYSLVSAFIMSTSVSVARRHEHWPPHVYGILAGFVMLVFAVATPLVSLIYSPYDLGAVAFPVLVLVMLYILAMSYMAVQSRRKRDALGAEEHAPETTGTSMRLKQEAPHVPPVRFAQTAFVDETAEKCRVLIAQKHLTTRESDILLLLAKGRDVPSIARQLYISENTVRSHSKSVYRKLEVHSKQGLLDLLEVTVLGKR